MYAYHFKATRRWSFAGALQAGMGQRSVNTSGLLFGNMIDPLTGAVDLPNLEPDLDISPHIYPDFAAGGTAFYNNYYGGIAVHHILNPSLNGRNETIEQIPRKYTLHFGAIFPVIEKRLGKEIMKLSPNFVFMQQQNIQQINYGLDVLYKDILAGIWTRHDFRFNYGNIIFTVGYSSSNLRFRYSYEFKLSRPTIALTNLAAHEISLLIITDNRTIRNKHSAIKCPKF
jgi:type IX secretion system PorP/SprF family membrane protein